MGIPGRLSPPAGENETEADDMEPHPNVTA